MKDRIIAAANAAAPELDVLVKNMYDNPELGYEEFKACKWHTEILEKHGFTVKHNYCDMETAFRAEYDSGKPGLTVGYLAEYDALPGVGQGCGHNILGATSDLAGIALKSVIDDIGGKVVVFGTPAEETSGAKVRMAELGEFDDVSIAMMAHPANEYAKSGSSLALYPLQFEFFGKPAHAAACPWQGINALDAAIQTINGINAMREHILPTSRVHGVIINGGLAANIVPDYTKVQYYIRSEHKKYNEELIERVKNCARAGALATGCRVEMDRYEEPYDDLVTNETLGGVLYRALDDIAGIKVNPAISMGSLDAGQVSHICPTVHLWFDITNNNRTVAGHSPEMASCTLTDYAKKQMRNTAAALALAAARVMTDPAKYEEIKREFDMVDR